MSKLKIRLGMKVCEFHGTKKYTSICLKNDGMHFNNMQLLWEMNLEMIMMYSEMESERASE